MFQQFSDDDDHNNSICDKDHNVDGDDAYDGGDDHSGNGDALCGDGSDAASDIDSMGGVHSGGAYGVDDGHNDGDAYGNRGGGDNVDNIQSIRFRKTVDIKSIPAITKNKLIYIIYSLEHYDAMYLLTNWI